MREMSVGGLKVRLAGGIDGQGGGDGPVILLLHGFGAPGDDLVPLADVIHVPTGTRWLFPEAPLSLNMGLGDSRAWWIIDFARIQADREAGRIRDLSIEVPQGLALARERMLGFLKGLPRQFPIDYKKTVIGGFSQGAMLTCDAILQTDYPFAGLVQLSGNLLAQAVWGPRMAQRRRLPVFQSHGTQDEILPSIGAERLRDALTQSGLAVEWHSFRGGHEIPEAVLRRLSSFITNVLAA
ncbi:alpha/beta hydrolase [Candidatus Nitrospira nitrificans]|uniref:Putative Carboxylesterase n=1 Tax=Candidatus Nitrospira nitrificans TaxID=1742973 RepID=A0A0S4LFQ5_9BACT|nr:phospholipase [Candidatus Nitrospira nitrificans]CUS36341.1 putative Carboxylesterase [Candidatus Nitrospira nitrificans]